MKSIVVALTTTSILLACSPSGLADDVSNGWRCFQGDGTGHAVTSIPLEWNAQGSGVAWQIDIEGYGQSSPVVHGNQVFVTSTSGEQKDQFHVSALKLDSGEQLWEAKFTNPTLEENSSYVSRAAPTPVVDSRAVFVLNEGGVLAALDHSGKVLWQRDLVAEYGPIKARHGLASSLEQNERLVFAWIERGEEPYLMAVEKTTGETVWKVAGLGATTWSSPRLIAVGNGNHLVCSASGKLVGIDPSSGERLWELTDIANNTSCTPVPAGNGRFIIGASDGRGEQSEGSAAASNGMVKIVASDSGGYSAEFVWRAEKATCSFGSPLVAAGKVWIVNRAGALYQLDLESGQQLSLTRVKSGSIWATPLHAAERVYLFGQKGITSVLSEKDGSELATNSLWDSVADVAGEPSVTSHVQYAVATADGFLLVRRGDKLFALK